MQSGSEEKKPTAPGPEPTLKSGLARARSVHPGAGHRGLSLAPALEHGFKLQHWDFPGDPVVNTSPSKAGGADSFPGQGAKIPHASRPKNQNIKQKQYCNKFNKDFKNGPHQKKKKIFKKKTKITPALATLFARPSAKEKQGALGSIIKNFKTMTTGH